jgi:parallel beta-helix repeat protein
MYDNASVLMMFDSVDLSDGNSFCIDPTFDGGSDVVEIFNSIIWPNDGVYGLFQALHFQDTGPNGDAPDVSLYYNTIRGYDGGGTFQDFSTASAEPQDAPQWINPVVGASADYGLLPTSTSINSGYPSGVISYPAKDSAGNPRVVGSTPDRGAVESPYVETPSTVVTSVADSGAGSLRAAIATANQFSNADTITFSPQLGCPAVIALQTALPTIHQPLTIDGYLDNPSAHPNTDPNAFNATICVVIKEASPGSIPSAITVDTYSGGLTLSGIAFGDFIHQVAILAGSDNTIIGNQFGGDVGGLYLSGGSSNDIWVHGIDSGAVTIGGDTPGERNVIDGAAHDGIFMDNTVTTANCHVDNNLIGLRPDGINDDGNSNGIELQNNKCAVSRNRIAGNLLDGIWIHGGTGNKIQSNIMGLTVQGNPSHSYGWAVRVEGNGNVIGASQTVGYQPLLGNAISFMDTGGIFVNGYNNGVRGNLSDYNGYANDGLAPDIQLGPNGNFQQPFPLIDKTILPNGSPDNSEEPATINGHLTSGPNSDYRIDVYYSPSCSPSGRGHADYYLTTALVHTDATGKIAFGIPAKLPAGTASWVLSLAATDINADSSEIGTCYPVDEIFKHDFGG